MWLMKQGINFLVPSNYLAEHDVNSLTITVKSEPLNLSKYLSSRLLEVVVVVVVVSSTMLSVNSTQ